MEVEISNAVKLFFPTSKFEFIYYEAIANSIDANATRIVIRNKLDSLKNSSSIKVVISDNGDGFNDDNFSKFSKLLNVKTDDHKGIGRLVYLNYFNNIHICSTYKGKKREFQFNEQFIGGNVVTDNVNEENKTTLVFTDYNHMIGFLQIHLNNP